MIVFLNGEFVPEERAVVSVFDRSFLYGDGLFETMRICEGVPFRWAQHLARLQRGAEFLKIQIPFSPMELQEHASSLIRQNAMRNGILRLTLSRGIGQRGYTTRGADSPTLVMTLHPAPNLSSASWQRWKLITSSLRVAARDPIANFKTCNKLAPILARAEAEAAGADEALLVNTDGLVAEGASSNVFWIQAGVVFTPPLAAGALAGVTRALVIELGESLGVSVREQTIPPVELPDADGVFLSLSSLAIVEAISLDGQPLRSSPLVQQFQATYRSVIEREIKTAFDPA
ncbi:MAG: aminotransferase class IV [Verrucomicrobia bacterium]|nr:aminotransferase class IV [Verrucomicrobiota bacterium]